MHSSTRCGPTIKKTHPSLKKSAQRYTPSQCVSSAKGSHGNKLSAVRAGWLVLAVNLRTVGGSGGAHNQGGKGRGVVWIRGRGAVMQKH
jgi:hypothetical protein